MANHTVSRRHFLRTTAAGLLAAPYVTTGLRAASPNGKLRHVSFGANGMALADLSEFGNNPLVEIIAVCDIDTRNFAKIKQLWPNARCYQNWRDVFAKEADNFDSVNVSTPDHMHGPIGLTAIEAGKHLYGQKPLAHNLYECRRLMERAAAKKAVTQMGIQLSSGAGERSVIAVVQQGAIGKIKEVHTFSGKKWGDMAPVPQRNDPVPAELDWNGWLGPAEERPFLAGYYHPGEWRRRRDFGTGTLGDMGCHIFSGWFRALELAAPLSVKSSGPPPPNATNWAINATVAYTFKGTKHTASDTVPVTWYDGDSRPPAEVAAAVGGKLPGEGSIYVGTDGFLLAPHGGMPVLFPKDKFANYKTPEVPTVDHYREFVDCCLKGGKPGAHFGIAGPLTEAVLLGCLASPFPGEVLNWDSAALKVSNNEPANALVRRSYRKGWELP